MEFANPFDLAALYTNGRYSSEQIQEYCVSSNTHLLFHPDIFITLSIDMVKKYGCRPYPQILSTISDPPRLLYERGAPLHHLPGIAVVGTRQVTQYGERVTRFFVDELVQRGVTIISGFMYGVDAVAHQTTIEKGGYTIAVLGFGLERMYPSHHRVLMKQLLEAKGTLLSEYHPWESPQRFHFPQRNRIVSGLSFGVLVTEAASKSGSKITASLATEQGRDVFAVPGPIDSPFSQGTKDLINLGAKLVTNAADIFETS